ncbi:MAG TPA: HAMP domain-containing sensor histidine kinase [Streptosporangiaceae bacterium]|jgi:signal transduction histidine kinase
MRRRLALLVSATMALVLIAFVVPLAILVRELAADRAISAAITEAQQLSAVVATSRPGALQASVTQLLESARHPATVFLPGGGQLGAPAQRTKSVRLSELGQSITVSDAGGREILVAVQSNGGTAVVRVFVGPAELTRGVATAWLILAAIGLVLLLLGMAVADRLLTSVTRPIGELAGVSHRLAAGELEARASPAGGPEVTEVAHGLNQLAARIQDLIWQERESIADLSHRLRTPLTALRLEAEAIPESADPDGRLTGQVQALERAVTELIENSRRRSGTPGSCDAVQVAGERAAFWSVLAEDQQRAVTVELAPPPVLVGVAAADLAACLDALLGNVFAHTPEGTAFTLTLTARAGGGGRLSVQDNGPGFAATDPVRRGASGAGSTGLGLDIARQTAQASGGSLTAGNEAGGALVVVELGPPRPAGTSQHDGAATGGAGADRAGEAGPRRDGTGRAGQA